MDPSCERKALEMQLKGHDIEDDDIEGSNEEDFTLEEVLRLGGTKQDYVMLAGLKEVDVMVDGGTKGGGISDLEDGELKAFIDKLGLHKFSPNLMWNENDGETKNMKDTEKDIAERHNVIKINTIATDPDFSKVKDKKKVNTTEKEGISNSMSKSKRIPSFEFIERSTLLIKPGGKWYDHEYTREFSSQPQNNDDVQKYKYLAEKLFAHEVSLYKNKKELQKGANSAWMKTVVSTGTLTDRMAAMTVLLQDAPVHTLQFVENLVNLLKKKGSKRQNLMALDTLKDLLLSDLLPDNRKLHTFSEHPFNKLEEISSGNRDARDRRLIFWYFEEQLKLQIAEFVKVLEILSHDSLIATKAKSLNVAYELLCNKPEEEKALLVLLVNKLGDPQYRIATKASYLIEVLLTKHPNMKGVVCLEVERLLNRPNISEKAQYYGICFLNQIIFTHEEVDLANQLIMLYFSFFRACIKKNDIDSKILRGLLTGLNRAYPYAQISNEKVKEQLDTLFKIVHTVNFNTAVQVLMLLFQVMDSQQTVSSRFYATLYRKLLDPGLSQCSKHTMFLNLLYKSMKADVMLRRVKAFVKRLLQVASCQRPSFICGALFLISEILKIKPRLRVLLQDNGENEDEEEHFSDLPDEDDEEEKNTDKKAPGGKITTQSWIHQKTLQGLNSFNSYDPSNRNPLFCGADNTSLWELKKLSEHFHPSVALFAKTVLEGNPIHYTGDPLQDFTLMRFLDRFVYRNPKLQKAGENRGYLMHQRKKLYMNQEKQPVNNAKFIEKEEMEVPVDEVFFHRYFKKISNEKPIKQNEEEDNLEDVDDDEFEQILDTLEGDRFCTTTDTDFAGNLRANEKKMKSTSENDDSDSDWDVDCEDDEVSLDSMCEEDFEDGSGGLFMDPSDEHDEYPEPKKTKKRRVKEDVFAEEEFGVLLDENSGSNTGLNAVANKDNASVKQLKWEAERDNWVKDRKANINKRRKCTKKQINKKK
ncbi:CCAAT/enhancer-binding protein zeta [Spea bombifrons]|uniref:CCAAT/enhancer-binding protein zeta n=1 Tax=Spea bombifrons TaxID=233779 RepID=UPI00234B53E7|nr:CCAAT/enhancer-binding protein zeta [Spea bombifrons]